MAMPWRRKSIEKRRNGNMKIEASANAQRNGVMAESVISRSSKASAKERRNSISERKWRNENEISAKENSNGGRSLAA
jgi:hypothetical protein